MATFDPFTTVEGVVAPIDRADVDTDQVIPKQFLTRVTRTGYGDYLFYNWATDSDGNRDESFVLNREPYNHASILLARKNFGCGSSREHAVWSIKDFGFRVVIAPSLADIFRTNCFKNGVLPLELEDDSVDRLFEKVKAREGYSVRVSLENTLIEGIDDDFRVNFEIDSYRRQCLLNGIDPIKETLQAKDKIRSYEEDKKKLWQDVPGK